MGSEEIITEERQITKMTTLRDRIKKLLNNGDKVLWSLQAEVISKGALDEMSEQDVRLEELKFAVFSSEVAYNMEMTELVNLAKRSITWIDPLAISNRRAIARTVEGVKRTSSTFLGHLEKEWAESTTITMQGIHEALSEMIPQFQNYVTYCTHQEELRSVIENAMFKKQTLFKASFSERMNVERVLLPLQRLQTLRLLLQEIRHELIPTSYVNENNNCKKALYKVTEFLDECYTHLAVLQGPDYTKKLNDALENNAYHYGLGIALKAENGSGRIDNLITFHEENYVPPRISRHASFLPRTKQNMSVEKIRHSCEGYSLTDPQQTANEHPVFNKTLTENNCKKLEKQLVRDNSNISQDSGISCDSWSSIPTPSDSHFNNEADNNKSHVDECNRSDCVFCQNNINECFNYILIGEIDQYIGEVDSKCQTNAAPTLVLQQLLIAPPKLLSIINNQQLIEFSKMNGTKNCEEVIQILERNNNMQLKHGDLIKFPRLHEDICFMPTNTCSNKHVEGNTTTEKDRLLAQYFNNKLTAQHIEEEAEDHIYAEPMYYSYGSSTRSSEVSTPTESDALSVNSEETPNIYDVPEVPVLHGYHGFKRSTLSLCHLSASLAEDHISRKTLLSACEDVPLYQIFTQEQEKFTYVDTEDGYIEPMEPELHIYEEIDTILLASTELDGPKEMNISRPTTQCQRLRWTETSEVIASGLTDKLDSTEIALQEAKFEIITSEVSYFKSLCILETIFMDSPLLMDRTILSQSDYDALFSTVQKVKKCCQQLLGTLTASFQEDLLLNKLNKVVSELVLSGALQVYVDYCKNHTRMQHTLKHLRETNATFASVLKQLEEDSACQMCSLQSFLTLPMQRVTRFPLLIKAILRYLPVANSEGHIWKMILFELHKVVESCNDAAGEQDQVNERLITPTLAQHPVEKKKSKHFWKKFKQRKCKI